MAHFGKTLLADFMLKDGYTFVNHGSYGAVARPVNEAKTRLQEDFESIPDVWFRRQYWDIYKDNLEVLATFLGTDPNNIVMLRNTTAAISTVLRHLDLGPGDKILIHSWTYGSMKTAVKWIAQNTGAEVVTVDLKTPLDKETLLKNFEDVVAKHRGSIKFAIIDYISSVPPVLFPWRELASLCQANNIQVLIDGAHAPGHIQLNLDSMDTVDYFVGNIHKWCYTHRGCAVLYVNPKLQKTHPAPLAISICKEDGDWRKGFYYQGTDDCTTYCVVKDALQYISNKGGLDAIMKYNAELVSQAAAMLAEHWGTKTFEVSSDLEAPNMRMVRLPNLNKFKTEVDKGENEAVIQDLKPLMFELMDRFHIIVACMLVSGEPYVRISANIYNCLEDYVSLAEAVLTLKHEEEEEDHKRL